MKNKEDEKYNFEGKLFPRYKSVSDKKKQTKNENMEEFVVPWQLKEKLTVK